MQAVILAAGMGKRLGELTRENTKCMVKVNGVPLIDRILLQLSSLHLKRILIVIGYKGEHLREYVQAKYADLNIIYIENKIYDKTNNIYSLSLTKEYLKEDDTLLVESDLIFDDTLFPKIVENTYPNLVMVAKYESWMDGTMVRLDEEDNIVNFIPKKAFRFEDAHLYYKTVNLYKFSRAFLSSHYIPFLEAYTTALGNNEYYEQVLRVITLLDNCDLKALPLNGEKWYEIDDVQDLDIAEALFAMGDNKLRTYQRRFGGYWRFPALLDYCYLVNPYFPTSRMKDELKANFDVLLTEYPSGMRINSLLAGKYFGVRSEWICVGNGAAELIKGFMENVTGKIGVIYPTFEEYPNRVEKERLVVYTCKDDSCTYSANDLISYFDNRSIACLVLVNPDNPSGNFIPLDGLHQLVAWADRKGIRLLVDESFVDFSDGGESNTLLRNGILAASPHLVVMKSISKSYGVPGLRLGVLASADETLVASLKKEVAIWNINSFAEYYMQIFGKYQADYEKACAAFRRERDRFYNELNKVDFLKVLPSQANYFLCRVTRKYTATSLATILLDKYGILIKDCSGKKGLEKEYVRIAVRDRQDNNRLLEVLLGL